MAFKRPFYYAYKDYVGQKFRHGTAGRACLCSEMCRVSAGKGWTAGSWDHRGPLHMYLWHLHCMTPRLRSAWSWSVEQCTVCGFSMGLMLRLPTAGGQIPRGRVLRGNSEEQAFGEKRKKWPFLINSGSQVLSFLLVLVRNKAISGSRDSESSFSPLVRGQYGHFIEKHLKCLFCQSSF